MLAKKILRAIENTEMSVFAQDLDLRYSWVSNAGQSWLAGAREGTSDADILGEVAAQRSTEMKREVLASGKASTCTQHAKPRIAQGLGLRLRCQGDSPI